jgi:hypothetical protein
MRQHAEQIRSHNPMVFPAGISLGNAQVMEPSALTEARIQILSVA